jgi:hypothetical protein
LKSVQKDFTPYSTGMDDVMYQKLREEQVKVITYRLDELSVREAPVGAEAVLKLEAKGSLAVAGVTNVIKMPVDLLRTATGFKVTGVVAAKMTDFKMEPPVVGPIKTGDDVQLSFIWFAEAKK